MPRNIKVLTFTISSLLSVLVVGHCFASSDDSAKPITAKVYENGSISLEDEKGVLGVIEPQFFSVGWKNLYHFENSGSTDPLHLSGVCKTEDGKTLKLKASIEAVDGGLKIKYSMVPSETVTIQSPSVSLSMLYDHWVGAEYQNGFYSGDLVSEGIAFRHKVKDRNDNNDYQCLVLIGPAKEPKGLCLKVDGDDALTSSLADQRKYDGASLGLALTADKSKPGKPVGWKGGSRHSFGFSLSFNRPVTAVPELQPSSAFGPVKATISKKAVIFKKKEPATPGSTDHDEVQVKPKNQDYDLPQDAKMADLYVDNTFGMPHLFVLAEFMVNGKAYKGWLNWDTGWHVDAKNEVDFQISTKFLKEMGLQKEGRSVKRGYFDVAKGAGKTLNVRQTYLSNDDKSDGGPVQIRTTIGQMVFEDTRLTADSSVDGVSDFCNEYQSFKKMPIKVVGSVPPGLMKKYLISIDYKNEKVIFRPLDSERRTFFRSKPLSEFDCLYKVVYYLPISLDGKEWKWAIYDTGDFSLSLDASKIPLSEWPVRFFAIGPYDFGAKIQVHRPKLWKHPSVELIGNDIFEGMFLTLDPKSKKVYIEKDDSKERGSNIP